MKRNNINCSCALLFFALLPSLAWAQPTYNQSVLNELIEFNRKMKTDRLVVSAGGSIIADEAYRGQADDPFLVYSITKLFSGIAVGVLIDRKLIEHTEVPIANFFPEWRSDTVKSKITIRHILQHTSGLSANTGSRDIYPQPDFVAYALNSSVSTPPGQVYFYNNRAINIVPSLVRKLTGKPLDEFIRENVFQPLNIENYTWPRDQAGNSWGMDGLRISATDLLKVGQMLSNYGTWQGKQILSKAWCQVMFQLPLVNAMNQTGGYGMCIRALMFDEKISITPEVISQLQTYGLRAQLADRLRSLQEKEHYRWFELGEALKNKLTIAEVEEISALAAQHLVPLYEITNSNFVMMHGGEFGLIVAAFPKTDVVLVRFLGEKWGRKMKEDGSDYKYLINSELLSFMIRLKR